MPPPPLSPQPTQSVDTHSHDTVTHDPPLEASEGIPRSDSRNSNPMPPPPLPPQPAQSADALDSDGRLDVEEAQRLETAARRQPYLEYYESLIDLINPGIQESPTTIYEFFDVQGTMSFSEEDQHIHSVCLTLFGDGFDVWEVHGVHRTEMLYVFEDFILNRARESDSLAMAWLGLFIQRTLDGLEVHGAWDMVCLSSVKLHFKLVSNVDHCRYPPTIIYHWISFPTWLGIMASSSRGGDLSVILIM